MSLPKIEYPLFDVVIPSTGVSVKMRPFLVKEEKILLFAQTTGNPKDIVGSIQQVVNNCIVENIDVTKLTTFDIEYLFVKLRARSVNNEIEIFYKDPEDEQQYKILVDLEKVEVLKNDKHSNKIEINPNVGIILKYPHTDMMEHLETVKS